MPLSVRTHVPVWKKRREVNTGIPTQSRLPLATAISSDDIDISETSNSLKCSWRQKISDGCATVQVKSIPSGEIAPLRTGCERSLEPMIKLSGRRAIAVIHGTNRLTWRGAAALA